MNNIKTIDAALLINAANEVDTWHSDFLNAPGFTQLERIPARPLAIPIIQDNSGKIH
jgi:hypothetical protein